MFLSGVIEMLNRLNLPLSVLRLNVDFEQAVISVARELLPNIQISGCFFHFAQANWRKVVDLGFRQRYVEDDLFAGSCRLLTALAFVPLNDVVDAFETVASSMADEMAPLITYYRQTYAGSYDRTSAFRDGKIVILRTYNQPMFPPQYWSVYQRVLDGEPRTNNLIEGWHRRFQVIVNKSHPNIHEFMKRLKVLQESYN